MTTTTRPLLWDLFCCRGGASRGYVDAGFRVIGFDIEDQPLYPYEFVQLDALRALRHWSWSTPDVIHASPPCQNYSTATSSSGNPDDHPDLVALVREHLDATDIPYVIENVMRSPVRRDLKLCGSMFDLRVRRHRVFEFGNGLEPPPQPNCRHAEQGRVVDVTGHAGGHNQADRAGYPIKWRDVDHAREVMEMPWSDGKGCTEAIPPRYTEHIGRHIIDQVR